MDSKPTVFVVDDNHDSRKLACQILMEMAFQVKAYSSAEEFLQSYNGERPACLLTDHRMSGISGVELLEVLRAKGMTLSVILMTAFAETALTVRAMRSGAVTILEKPFTETAVWEAVNEALSVDKLEFEKEVRIRQIAERLESLTAGEVDVLNLIVKGAPNKAVARKLGVSVRTVEHRRHRIFEKMGVGSIAELVSLVMTAKTQVGRVTFT